MPKAESKIRYSSVMGDAGQKYLDDLCKDQGNRPVWLPATFRWETLFEKIMAALQDNCPGHVSNNKTCARCGIHIDELR